MLGSYIHFLHGDKNAVLQYIYVCHYMMIKMLHAWWMASRVCKQYIKRLNNIEIKIIIAIPNILRIQQSYISKISYSTVHVTKTVIPSFNEKIHTGILKEKENIIW